MGQGKLPWENHVFLAHLLINVSIVYNTEAYHNTMIIIIHTKEQQGSSSNSSLNPLPLSHLALVLQLWVLQPLSPNFTSQTFTVLL